MIHVIQKTAQLLRSEGVGCVGLMATDGTVESGIFQKELEAAGISVVLPDEQGQRGVMTIIYDQVKAGIPADLQLFHGICGQLRRQGAQVVILGCTELSLLKKQADLGDGILDVLDVLAKESVIACGKPVKPEYQKLFTV